ncbi:MAG: hypothetical protein AVDCRST_MAG68-1087 [uncultured Gemmatimonadetes bacterium]|uniref:3-keto-disaccharide hydrolase domain-containing protein n=1 Tax=uncultured Gemmatimonadota bacterium TaxID=203437 RepID=A0A6J4KNU6_9BACT|nr:MAG: hypothetical protein AVDCRST_MAG68-1087 [uncultured Gemmatimonadota bacterium]
MRKILPFVAVLAFATPLAAQHNHGHAQGHAHEMGALPDGWKARLDRGTDMSKVHFMAMSGGYHAILGPAAVFYRPADQARGMYTVQARFNQRKAPTHPEAYGLVYGARGLEGDAQEYFYFLVRGDGKYSVRHRAGSEVHTLQDWTEHAAVAKQDSAGAASNLLAVRVGDTTVDLMVNGTRVAQYPRAQMSATDGVHGLRINHNLDVLVDQYSRQ